MPEQNVIVGPDGEVIARPTQVLTGIDSHVKGMVRAMDEYLLTLERMVRECRRTKDELDDKEPGSGEGNGAEILGRILALSHSTLAGT